MSDVMTAVGRMLSGGNDGWRGDPSSGGLFILLAMLTGVLCRAGLRELRHRLNLPFTVLVLIVGMMFAGVADNTDLRAITDSLTAWVNIDPHHMLFLLFPALIFGFAFQISFNVFLREAPIILILAVPGVAIQTLLTGAAPHTHTHTRRCLSPSRVVYSVCSLQCC